MCIRDRYNLARQVADVTSIIPPGQPTEIHITLYYYSQLGNSAKCDIYLDVPGTKTSFNPSNNDEFNWKFSVQRKVVNTVGVPGQKHEIGLECGNGRMTSGIPFTIRMDVTYEKDVFTPYHPYAFQVPANASGIILESAKGGGPEHLRAWFIVVSPRDELVAFVDFNDIAIPTESVFIATPEPGEYVFYAHNMTGGFLRMRADSPVEQRDVRILRLAESREAFLTGPSPGVAPRDWFHGPDPAAGLAPVETPGAGGQEATFNVDGTFPLRIAAFIGDPASGSRTLMSDVRISSSKGLVAYLQRVARYDDERGSLGVSQDEWNSAFQPWNLQKGAYTVQIVNNSPDASVGRIVTTYVR